MERGKEVRRKGGKEGRRGENSETGTNEWI